uniref:Uncharacterized protein n=1 Tax=Anguilla anguilla TaxID=7936 RepID=A0A0E9SGA9_ANGAN
MATARRRLDDDVSVPPDGRGEVGVDGGCQAVVVEVAVHAGAEVDGLHHAAGGQDAQQRVEVGEAVHLGLVQRVCQGLGRVRVDVQVFGLGGLYQDVVVGWWGGAGCFLRSAHSENSS